MSKCRGKGAAGHAETWGSAARTSAWLHVPAELLELQTHLPASAARQKPASPSTSLRASGPLQVEAGEPGGVKAPTAWGLELGPQESGTGNRNRKSLFCSEAPGGQRKEHRLLPEGKNMCI